MQKAGTHECTSASKTTGAAINYAIENFGLGDMLHLGLSLRPATEGKATMEEAADALCKLFYEHLVDRQGERACALVRFYKTHRYGDLPQSLQKFASDTLAPLTPTSETNCLTLLATTGDEREWNSRSGSRGHQVIPLASPEIVENAPMISELIKQFGIEISEVVGAKTRVVKDLQGRNYGVFYVARAHGSPFIPAQNDFVVRYGIQSVLGFGGTLGSGDLFTVILFSRTPIPEAVPEYFRRLAADVRVLVSRFRENAVFADAIAGSPA